MKHARILSFLLTGVVCAAGVLAAWSLLNGSQPAQSAVGDGAGPIRTPTPNILPTSSDMTAALSSLRGDSPKQAALIDAFLKSDSGAVVNAAPSRREVCERLIFHGVTMCETRGYPPGTVVYQVQLSSESLPGFSHEFGPAVDTIRYLTEGRHPSLELLAARDDGALLAVIGVDPRPALQFPGPLELGGADEVALYIVIGADGQLVDLSTRVGSAPPLEPIQDAMRRGDHTFVVIAVSQSLADRERTWFQEDEKSRHTPPATP